MAEYEIYFKVTLNHLIVKSKMIVYIGEASYFDEKFRS
ncbi:hypothetical protein T06_4576 [Trichinella sp. T6]|nr:hypothetical protein T06_4576 [Trichinella sp. T6]